MDFRAPLGPRLPVIGRERGTVRAPSRAGDRVLMGLCALAALLAAAILIDIAYQVYVNAKPAISRFGIGFLTHSTWEPALKQDFAGAMVFGTLVSSGIALLLAAPLGIGIGLYLSMMAPRALRGVIGTLVEMLAAIPSVIVGFWGVVVFAPFLQHLEPGLHSALGFLPLFGEPQTTGFGLLAAGIVLAMMILPIISSLSRDLFLTVPAELKDGAAALGATRWEVIRGVVLPSTASGIAAATVLALGRALGEAIAISLVIGDLSQIKSNLFLPGSTLASRIASEFTGPANALHVAALFYLGLVLLAIGLVTSLLARTIAGRFDVTRAA